MFRTLVIIADVFIGGLLIVNLLLEGGIFWGNYVEQLITALLPLVNVIVLVWYPEGNDYASLFLRRKKLEQQKKINDLQSAL